MDTSINDSRFFGEAPIGKILLRIAPPVMLAQLIQALYNIVDSYFIGQYSEDGLTALSVIFPIQLIISALAVGTGVGVNTHMSRLYARRQDKEADRTAGAGMVLAIGTWLLFAVIAVLGMEAYVRTSASAEAAVRNAVIYGRIVCAGSLFLFLESIWTKVHQARGNMRLPMIAQVVGAVVNIILDPLLIFGWGPFPALGIAGAAIATVTGQLTAAAITAVGGIRRPPAFTAMMEYIRPIYRLGYPSILMQSLYTVYIAVLNMILAGFCDEAVTVLGLYYKMQSFFFIPLSGLQTCIVPVLSYNYATRSYDRCKAILRAALLISGSFMTLGVLCFEFCPGWLITLFSGSARVLEIGIPAFRLIGLSFYSAVFSLIMPVYFQAVGEGGTSSLLSLTRQIFCLIPIFWVLSLIGLNWVWLAFPLSETIAGALGFYLYRRQTKAWECSI